MAEDKRVEDLWFSSDVVLRAEKSIFHVSKSILAARSSVFRDMVAFPQPPTGETEMIDGCPVVSLHDSAADVEVFLRAIFDSRYLRFNHRVALEELWDRLPGIYGLSPWPELNAMREAAMGNAVV